MKFTTLLTLLPLVSVALAAPNPASDQSCVSQYCKPFSNAYSSCDPGLNADRSSQEYLGCLCSAGMRSLANKYGCLPLKLLRLNSI